MSDQLVTYVASYTTDNKHKRWTSRPSAGCEPAIQAIERLKNYALDRMGTGTGK